MAVIRKRRTLHTKSSRQQQLQQQQQLRAKQRFENSRLKPEQSTTMIHDESDTVSFRSYLLMNFVKSAEYMDVMMTQAIPNDKIRPPAVFPNSATLEAMKERLSAQKEQLRSAKEALDNFSWGLDEKFLFLKDKLAETERQPAETGSILREYLRQFNLRDQADRVVYHREKFNHLRGDMREAPKGYWEQHSMKLQEMRKKALMEKKQQEEEEREKQRLWEFEKRKREMEDQRRREEKERQRQLEQLQTTTMSQAGASDGHLAYTQSSHGQFSQGQPIAAGQFTVSNQAITSRSPIQLPIGSSQYYNEQESQANGVIEQHQQHLAGQAQGAVEDDSRQGLQHQQQQQESQQRQQHEQEQGQQRTQQPQQEPQQLEQQLEQQQERQQPPPSEPAESIFGDFGDEPFNNGFEEDFGDMDAAFF